MIVVIDTNKQTIESFTTLKQACKLNHWMRYQYLKDINLNNTWRKYKNVYLCKV